MKRKIGFSIVFMVMCTIYFSKMSFAKYIFQNTLQLGVYIDKTPPIIFLKNNEIEERYQTMPNDIIIKKSDVIIRASDNVAIERNYYYYNSINSDFSGISSTEFDDEITFSEEGYYKIISVDTSGNTSEIILLIDTSPPTVTVRYYKKDEIIGLMSSSINFRKVAGKYTKLGAEEIIIKNDDEIQEDEETENQEIEDTNENLEDPKEENVIDNEEISEVIQELENDEEISKTQEENFEQELIVEENSEENTEETVEENHDVNVISQELQENYNEENDESKEIIEQNETIQQISDFNISQSSQLMLMASQNGYVGNEQEFRNALSNYVPVIHVRQSINFTAPIYINYDVTIVDESDDNALRYYGQGNFIVVQNGGSLVINGMVVDTNSSGVSGINAIVIENGGLVTFINSSIVDGGYDNTGILICGGGNLILWSCKIVHCNLGINLQENGNLYFATQEGKINIFYQNNIALFIDNFFGNCDLNQNICMHDNLQFGVYIEKSNGNINISAGSYYNNTYAVHTRYINNGNVTISGGDYYSNGWAVWAGGNITISGGTIHENYYGVLTDPVYDGRLFMTDGNIYSNSSYAICHDKTNDGGCTILGGTISGEIYLNKDDNYVNTNSSYPTFTVTPSSYYFRRKLVKTDNSNAANAELPNVGLTGEGTWYKHVDYIDTEYIVLWKNGNLIVRCLDYYDNILKQVILNGTVGENYTIGAPDFDGYDLVFVPSNYTGKYSENDIFIDFRYDLLNVAKVNFEDLLSGIVSAKYWFNKDTENFSGNGTDFENGAVFENYGYYKILVKNGAGLEKELKFALNKDSYIR